MTRRDKPVTHGTAMSTEATASSVRKSSFLEEVGCEDITARLIRVHYVIAVEMFTAPSFKHKLFIFVLYSFENMQFFLVFFFPIDPLKFSDH